MYRKRSIKVWRRSLEKNKIETYLGFCIRARKIVFGVDSIETQKKEYFYCFAIKVSAPTASKHLKKSGNSLPVRF